MPGGGERLAEALRVLTACGCELDADQVLDVLWLASRLPASAQAPLHRTPGATAGPPAQPPPAAEPDPAAADRPVPEPDDPGLPDLTVPALYAAARQSAAATAEPRPAGRPEEPRKAMPVRAPEHKALSDELELGRALRPLRRRQDSTHRYEVDEERTAEELAETGLADVVERPVRERWLNLILLVDDCLSMLLWHRLGAELRTLLERLGAFATTRVLGLDTRARQPALHARPFQQSSMKLPLSSVNDPSGRSLVLVVSDGMGVAWRTGAMHGLLAKQAASGPVAVLHTLPPDIWESSGIAAERWQVTTRRIGGANTSWTVSDPVLPPGLVDFDGYAVPVLEPTPGALRAWAHLLASPGTTAELPLLSRPSRHGSVIPARLAGSAQHFRDAATPEAYRLAAHLAAVAPLSVPVMRLVQTAVPWPATTSHLAEVFLGGLMRPHPSPVPGPLPAKHRVFDFSDASKTVLLDAVPQAELLRTSRRIGRRLEQLAGSSPEFPAWLTHPDGFADLPASHHPFTHVERRLLSRLGVSVGEPLPGTAPGPDDADGTDWGPLTDADPREVGPYRITGRRRGRRTVVYRAFGPRGTPAVIRMPRPDLPAVHARLIEVEAEVLGRLQGQHAPKLLATGLDDSPPWLAMTPVADGDTGDNPPLLLEEIFAQAMAESVAPFDILRGLLVSWYLASALVQCHANGLVLADLSADRVFVLRRDVVLGDLSDCVVDGEYPESGPAPTRADNVRALGELLQMIGSKAGVELPGLPEGMHLWQGGTWESLRLLVLRCLDPDPAARPAASEVADLLARYVAQARLGQDTAPAPVLPPRPAPAPLTPPPVRVPSPDRLGPRLPRFGQGRRTMQERLERLRVPLSRSRRITLVGAYHYSGRATTTVALGSLLAAVRGEPVLALDGAATDGSLHAYVRGRGEARLRDLALLPADPTYPQISALTTELDSGLEIVAHRDGYISPNPAHAYEYDQVLAHVAPHYPFVLTDWSLLRLDRAADFVLNRTDRLVLCCGTADWFIDAAARSLAALREGGHEDLAREVIVVATRIEQPSSRDVSARIAQRLGVDRDQVVQVPFDGSLRSGGFGLTRLRVATTDAFLRLAELIVGPGDGDPGPPEDPR
ncbi:SAV_2336 N-terminal domain-related protein [Streptomyces sp. WMMC500]|uniref:SAV_2336 N-terminal domain-related protein n=1 Tax=Streptomyces sp. WMMC500 TaxID=3015154 RepID=UPI00248B4F37|nr:SAV_2336 N-terminal domain-related protein [Streptomyces sp. WMMC500]WBB62442.1 SAV_2336 N-terminal domain-related protein [Streptomyces sp. WMMC500]